MFNNAEWIKGKTVLVTGGTGGIGKETALGLAARGAHVVITGRSAKTGEKAVEEIRSHTGNTNIDLMFVDMASFDSIRRFAADFTARYPHLHVLINNVGLLTETRQETVDGFEQTFAVNHLAPFLLTHLLLPLLKSSTPSRVVNVTGGMPNVKVDLQNLQGEKRFVGMEAYAQAKVVMMIASFEFARRLENTGVTLNVAYPGGADTAMTRGVTAEMMPPFMRVIMPIFRPMMAMAKPQRAARSSIYLASSPEVEGVSGKYFNTNSKVTSWPKTVADAKLREQIWRMSEQLTALPASRTVLS
jgi:NAD(P)-dependent dehydrogenase (short-subunit alcohol dehydrogenase family)